MMNPGPERSGSRVAFTASTSVVTEEPGWCPEVRDGAPTTTTEKSGSSSSLNAPHLPTGGPRDARAAPALPRRGAPNTNPTATAQLPDTTIAALVTNVRPQRSAYFPPSQHPIAPLPTTANVTRAASPVTSACAPRRACSLAATNTAIHVHIAYSSHMWPRYPRLASATARSLRIRGAAERENGGEGAANGPSFGTRR